MSKHPPLDKTGRFQDKRLEVINQVVTNVPLQENTGWIFILNKGYGDLFFRFRHIQKMTRQTFTWPGLDDLQGQAVEDYEKCHGHQLSACIYAGKESLLTSIFNSQKKQLFMNFLLITL